MKRIIYLLILLVLIQIVSADTLNRGESTSVSGKTVILVSVSSTSVIVSVDGIKNIVSLNDQKEINGINVKLIELTSFGDGDGSAVLELSGSEETVAETKPICGDGICNDATEDSANCCKDCRCEYGFGCTENKCIKAECLKDSDCYANPKNYCSLDKCDPILAKCTHKPIIDCVINDKCCPTSCYYPEDSDCPTTKLNPNPTHKKETTTTNQQGNETGSNQMGEKVGFFQKIINWFLNLFKK